MDAVIEAVDLLPIDGPVAAGAGTVGPPALRSLDAIHLATALSLGADLEVLITYDERLAEAAGAAGIAAEAPR